MPFQPPSIMAACMILLAAPKLAASMPAVGERGLMLCQRQETGEDGDELQPIVCEERPIIPTPEYTTPTGSLTPVEPAEPQVYFAYQGCYNEPKRGGRALEHVWMDDGMTPSRCEEHAAGFAYHGVEYGNECWYGNTLRKGSSQRDDAECKKPCAGDLTQTCGDGMRLNLWRRTDAHIPLDQPNIGDYILQGCYVDIVSQRALPRVLGDDNMTPQKCSAFCAGSAYMGLEYGRECWCGDELNISSFKATLNECQMPCAGDLGSVCGGPNRMDLYKLGSPPAEEPQVYSMGCYFDDVTAHRALPELYADDNMSIELCAGFAARHGFKQFGVENGRECWAGPELHSSAFSTDGCDIACSGNDEENCGGRQRLNMFTYDINDIYEQNSTPERPGGSDAAAPAPEG